MKRLVLHDDYCRRTLMIHGFLVVLAIGFTGFVLTATGFRTGALLTAIPALTLVVLASGLASWVELRARGGLLRHLMETGVRMPVTQSDVEWSDDPESSYGTGLWPYSFQGNRYEVRTLEHLLVNVPEEATALVDPDQPERAILLMANGITRGGYGLSEGSLLRRIGLGTLLLTSWAVWTVGIGLGLIGLSR